MVLLAIASLLALAATVANQSGFSIFPAGRRAASPTQADGVYFHGDWSPTDGAGYLIVFMNGTNLPQHDCQSSPCEQGPFPYDGQSEIRVVVIGRTANWVQCSIYEIKNGHRRELTPLNRRQTTDDKRGGATNQCMYPRPK